MGTIDQRDVEKVIKLLTENCRFHSATIIWKLFDDYQELKRKVDYYESANRQDHNPLLGIPR